MTSVVVAAAAPAIREGLLALAELVALPAVVAAAEQLAMAEARLAQVATEEMVVLAAAAAAARLAISYLALVEAR